MYKFNDVLYYSMDELAKAMNEPESEIEKSMAEAWNKHYGRSEDVFTTSSFIYSKLHKAVIHKQIKHITFQKGVDKRNYVAFNPFDVIEFVNTNDFQVSRGYKSIHNVKLVEVEG